MWILAFSFLLLPLVTNHWNNIVSKVIINAYRGMLWNSSKILSFMNRVSEANVVKWKGSKTGIKNFACSYMDGGSCVCLTGLKSWITFDGMKGFWWNFQDQSNSSQVIFGQENLISRPKCYNPVFRNSWKILLMKVLLKCLTFTIK